jgi:hypothetical protein
MVRTSPAPIYTGRIPPELATNDVRATMSGNGVATVQGYGQLLGQEKKAGVVY